MTAGNGAVLGGVHSQRVGHYSTTADAAETGCGMGLES